MALADQNPFPGKKAEWRWMFNSLGAQRWRSDYRLGVSMREGNPTCDRYTIADVGLPPVNAYRVLITMFVVCIGPVNYWLLRRWKRLHLLLVSVPLAAFAVSLALVLYAVFADGFDTYVRAVSFTRLDQARGEAVSVARLSYYAGMAPSAGQTLGTDTMIVPIDRHAIWNSSPSPRREVDWTSEQHLVRGWTPSRTPVQYLTVRPHASGLSLAVQEADARCAIDNRLEAKIERVLLRSAGGKLYFGQDVERGARAELELLDAPKRTNSVTLDFLRQRARGEGDLAVATPASRLFFGSSYTWHSHNASTSTGEYSLLQGSLAATFDEIGSQLTTPRTYVAIVERPPDVTIGVDEFAERQSLHVIHGTW